LSQVITLGLGASKDLRKTQLALTGKGIQAVKVYKGYFIVDDLVEVSLG
jgi:hypothetical protein